MDPMLSQALRTAYGPLADFAKKAAKNPDEWHAAFARFLRKENPWAEEGATSQNEMLRLEYSAAVTGENPFVAGDHFKVNVSPTAPVKIGHLGDNFKRHFLPVIEEDVKPVTLMRHTVQKVGHYIPHVFWELGERHEVKLAHLWEALCVQRNGEDDGLLHIREENFLFMFGTDHALWVVCVRWGYMKKIKRRSEEYSHDGWSIRATPFGRHFFSNYSFARIISSVK